MGSVINNNPSCISGHESLYGYGCSVLKRNRFSVILNEAYRRNRAILMFSKIARRKINSEGKWSDGYTKDERSFSRLFSCLKVRHDKWNIKKNSVRIIRLLRKGMGTQAASCCLSGRQKKRIFNCIFFFSWQWVGHFRL